MSPTLFKISSNQHFTYHRENWISNKRKFETRVVENAEDSRPILNPLTEKTNMKHKQKSIQG